MKASTKKMIESLDLNELNQALTLIARRKAALGAEKKDDFVIGQAVIIKHKSLPGGSITGLITKINRKNVVVDTDLKGLLSVPPALLFAAVTAG